jgi:hypothetical protein
MAASSAGKAYGRTSLLREREGFGNKMDALRLFAAHSCFIRMIARASVKIACRGQFRLPPGLGGLQRPWPLGSSGFQRLPSRRQVRPECPVVGIACRSSKAAAFVGSSPEFFQYHVTPLC